MARTLKDKLFLDTLYRNGYITLAQRKNYKRAEEVIGTGLVSSDIIIETLASTLQIPILDIFHQKITILEFSKVSEYSLHGYFICTNSSGAKCCVITNPFVLKNAQIMSRYKKYQIMLIKKQDFYDALEHSFSKFNTQKSLLELGFINPRATARSINYHAAFVKTFSIMLLVGYIANTLFVAINYIIYLAQTCFKMWLFIDTSLTSDRPTHLTKATPPKYYPIYSILIPMYKEAYGVRAILYAMEQIDYPRHRLDIKLVVEDDDEISLKILSMIDLPEYVHVIKVPYSEPRTKPKALNYACLLYTSPSPRDVEESRMPSSA